MCVLQYMLPGPGSLLFVIEISEADSSKFGKVRFLGGRQYCQKYDIVSIRK